ncbi:MAG TPA: RagB/SusD family nutrient uptake outer membrane protein [Bacteroidales bacterium]|nr:RagB/SusD family nutrient uptake outer membrane protein [Bacteroidales bacterium]
MKYTFNYILIFILATPFLSCSLNEDPISDYSEIVFGSQDTSGTLKFRTRADMFTQYQGVYNQLKGNHGLENWNLDFLVYTETHSDNAYRGATDAELTQLEQQKQNGINKNIERDWKAYLEMISNANSVIVYVDSVPDPALTAAERKQWKSEALILRAWIMFDMVRLWGGIPMILTEPPAINSRNIEEVYPLYYPPRNTVEEVYAQIISDLETALEPGGAPPIDPSNKFKFSRTVANALLAKVYAEQPVRDYNKVIEYCELVEPDVSLVSSYGDLFLVNDSKTDVRLRNSSESIFEITFADGGNWNTWMFGVDETDPASVYDWAKWMTPTRDLIAAFDKQGDIVRKRITMVQASVAWSNHYPSDQYWFMHKFPSKFNSIIKLRLADILLLKAEAYTALGDLTAAADIVRRIRARVGLGPLGSAQTGTQDAMMNAVLNERRLELAFEGQRWFDLVRTGKVYDVLNTLNQRDPGRLAMDPVTENSIYLPIPQSQVDINPSLVQNPGY